jgi:hypothetical protein
MRLRPVPQSLTRQALCARTKDVNSGWPAARRRGEFRVELAADEPRMPVGRQFDHLAQIGRPACGRRPPDRGSSSCPEQCVVDLVAVTMTLDDLVRRRSRAPACLRPDRQELAAEAHRAAEVRISRRASRPCPSILPLGDQADHRMRRIGVELGAVRAGFRPATSRANSTTASCMPRQMPR